MREIVGTIEYMEKIYSSERVVVEFFTPTCVNCKLAKQILERQEENGITVFTVDASKQENQELVRDHKIMSVPFIRAYYNTKGETDVSHGVHTVKHGLMGKQLIDDLRDFFSQAEATINTARSAFQFELKEVKGDLFKLDDCELFPETTSKDYVLAHCVASDFGMFGGIARQFVLRKDMKRKLIQWAEEEGLEIEGGCRSLIGRAIFIQDTYNLVTKYHTSELPSGYDDLYDCLVDMRGWMIANDQSYLAIPRIGCGIDGLDWDEVKRIINAVFEPTDIKIVVVNL